MDQTSPPDDPFKRAADVIQPIATDVRPKVMRKKKNTGRQPVRKAHNKPRTPFSIMRVVKGMILTASVLGIWSGLAMLSLAAYWSKDLPTLDRLGHLNRPISIQIVDRYGRDLLVRGADADAPVRVQNLPPHMIDAVLAIEDRRFFSHVGVDPQGLLRAALANAKAGRVVQGGSTLTQQLTKNIFLTPDQTFKRKGQEMLLSLWLEHHYTKSEILEMYLNRVYFGNGSWGLSAAAQGYFGKLPSELSLTEAALLAGLLKAPSRYNAHVRPALAAERTAIVLAAMEAQDRINTGEELQALTAPVHIRRQIDHASVNYFVDWIWPELDKVLEKTTTDIVVQTTLDRDAQLAAHTAVTTHLDPERNARQAALVSIDGSGAVLAMIGGASYSESQFNRATQARRQPGSAFKPFVYLSAFEAGLTPWHRRVDAPIMIDDWAPRNFSEEHKGEISLEEAFAKSINTVAVILGEDIGRERIIETATPFGFDTLKPLRSLALGAQAATPLQVTNSYLPFANWGQRADPFGILSISTANGTPLYVNNAALAERLIDTSVLRHMNRVMTETVKTGTGRRAQIEGHTIGGKTGTTNDFRDAWFIGYAPDIVTGVWVGADDFTPMQRVTGGSIPADIWQDFMQVALLNRPAIALPVSTPPQFQTELKGEIPTDVKPLELLLNDIQDSLP